MRHIIVDGYNVIRADPRLCSLERVSLEHAREVLARTLGSSPRLSNDRVMVVFDGTAGNRSHVHTQRLGRIELLYSARGQSADEVIVQQASSLAGGNRVVVVTNDVEVRERCRAAGADVTGSENLLGQLPGRQRLPEYDNEESGRGLSTDKRGNPRRASRKARRRDIRF